MGFGRIALVLVLGIIAVIFAIKVIGGLLGLVLPLLILGVVVFAIYKVASPSSLGGSGRSLP